MSGDVFLTEWGTYEDTPPRHRRPPCCPCERACDYCDCDCDCPLCVGGGGIPTGWEPAGMRDE